MNLPPLSLYIHLPWCVQKCPYCDFNSHTLESNRQDFNSYIDALAADFADQYQPLGERPINTIFIGGGTPSLLPGAAVERLLSTIRRHAPLAENIEITLEANPGAIDAGHFYDYRLSGINRLSIGIQSFDNQALESLGRIHDHDQAITAYLSAQSAGFDRINLDLMFGLPNQSINGGLKDLQLAVELGPTHLSWYQLTLEPNTPFAHAPPSLPEEETIDEIHQIGIEYLEKRGLERYEISAFAAPDSQCRHNINYWRFGDYIGIGAGAHGKLTRTNGEILRTRNERGPERYLAAPKQFADTQILGLTDLPFEFMMNALRLKSGVHPSLFQQRTGLALGYISKPLETAVSRGLLETSNERIVATDLGFRFLNDLIGMFLYEQ